MNRSPRNSSIGSTPPTGPRARSGCCSSANGNPIRAIFFFTSGIGGGSAPTDAIGDSMFKPLDEGRLGIEELRFLTPQVWGSLFHARSGYEKCDVGFLPDKG